MARSLGSKKLLVGLVGAIAAAAAAVWFGVGWERGRDGDRETQGEKKQASSSQVPRGNFEGKVVAVLDGDTIDVLYEGRAVRVRLAEIDCPEKKQAFGRKAKQRTAELASGRSVRVEVRTVDLYGRAVAKVVLPDGSSLNEALLRDGFAWWYKRYSKDERLGALEQEARDAKRGLWADDNPVPPWKFRKRHRGKRNPEKSESKRAEPSRQ
jgi:micrococcal nuclease